MSSVHAGPQSLPHAVFLHRVTEPPRSRGLQARLGQGAFLALRLIDLLDSSQGPVHPDAFNYQWAATDRFCTELKQVSTEGAHLHGLVTSAAAAHSRGDINLLSPGFIAYSHYLEDELQLEEALDVLATLDRITAGRLSTADGVAVSLRVGRLNRKLGRFDAAEEAYATAGARAKVIGDGHSVLLARLGAAECIRGRGNLPLAAATLDPILVDARAQSDIDIESRVEHVTGVVLYHMGQPVEAIPHVWRAFELYDEEDLRLRALNDAGIMLLMLGDVWSAERALSRVVQRSRHQDNVSNALIELMHCASYRRDQIAFSRRRAECERRKDRMPPNILIDYHLKAGIGEARFGQFTRAQATLDRALQIAERARAHEFVFRIERIRNGLQECEEVQLGLVTAESEPFVRTDALEHVSASLVALGEETT